MINLFFKNLKIINSILVTNGLDIRKILKIPRIFLKFIKDLILFKSLGGKINYFWPVYFEDKGFCSELSDYSILSFLVIRDIFLKKNLKHFDIGSSVEMFILPLSATGIKVTLLDIRKTNFLDNFEVKNRVFDACKLDERNLSLFKKERIRSLSCIHAIEHFGLGRYGDQIDPKAQEKFIFNVSKILSKNAIFYLGIPIGNNEIYFNSHRLMSLDFYINLVSRFFEVDSIFGIDPIKENKYTKLNFKKNYKFPKRNNFVAALLILKRK